MSGIHYHWHQRARSVGSGKSCFNSNRYKKLTLGASVTKTGWLPPTRVDYHQQDAQISSHSPCLNSPSCGLRSFPRPLFWPRNWDHWRKLGLLQRGQHLHQDCQQLFLRWLWDGSLRKNWISIQWTVQCGWSRLGLQVRIFNHDGIRQYLVFTCNILGLKHELQGQVPWLQIQLQWKPVKDKRDR